MVLIVRVCHESRQEISYVGIAVFHGVNIAIQWSDVVGIDEVVQAGGEQHSQRGRRTTAINGGLDGGLNVCIPARENRLNRDVRIFSLERFDIAIQDRGNRRIHGYRIENLDGNRFRSRLGGRWNVGRRCGLSGCWGVGGRLGLGDDRGLNGGGGSTGAHQDREDGEDRHYDKKPFLSV